MSDKENLLSFEPFPASSTSLSGRLTIIVERSTGIPQEFHEVYVSLKLTKSDSSKKSVVLQTKPTPNSTSLEWNEEFLLSIEDKSHQVLHINLMGKKTAKTVSIAKFTQNLTQLTDNVQQQFVYSPEGTESFLYLKLHFQPSQGLTEGKKLIKIPNFRIELFRAHYYPGETVEGKVVYSNQKPKKIRGIRLRIHCYEHVYWTEKHGKHTVVYLQNRWYFQTLTTLFGLEKGQKGKVIIEPGLHEWPFKFQIPPTMPPSFFHLRGQVINNLTANVDIPYAFDKTAILHFFVYLPEQRIPKTLYNCVEYQVSDNKGNVHAKVKIAKSVWIPGDTIEIFTDVKNDSKDTIHKIEWRLKEFGEYHSTTKTIRLPFTFSKERLDHLQLECGRSWSEKLLLKIPEKIQPTLTKDISQIIFNEYFIKISLKYHVLSALKFQIPVFIWKPMPTLSGTPQRFMNLN